ncbi:MAG: DUF4350 domain-containing protein [Actinomycetota bacterium]|nr:DUF4350 domain-containing protein [Actinomycetota bacterium]
MTIDAGGLPAGPDLEAEPVEPVELVGPATPSPRRRVVRWVLVGLVVLAVAVVMLWRGPGPPTTQSLDPRNPGPNGAQALARVLGEQGVDVTVARGQAELARAGVDADTTVLVARTGDLAEATITRLASLTRSAERLVVVNPDTWVLRYLSADVEVRQLRRSAADEAQAGCASSDLRPGETLSHTQSEFRRVGAPASAACLTHEGYSVYLALPRSASRAPLVLLGSSSALTNDEIDQAQNAAVVLRTLGHSSRLVWYVPSVTDIPTTDESRTGELLPPWLGPGALLGGFALAALLVWRGRRLGRLVREPLPVAVRAIETTESRGRIYRRAQDLSRAAAILQDASRRRLAAYFGLPRRASVETVAVSVSVATGRPVEHVRHLLAGPPPSTQTDLLALAAQLTALEKLNAVEKEARPS